MGYPLAIPDGAVEEHRGFPIGEVSNGISPAEVSVGIPSTTWNILLDKLKISYILGKPKNQLS